MSPATDRPNVLAITSETPWPLDAGGRLRAFHLLRHVAAACDLTLVCPVPHQRNGDRRALADHGIQLAGVTVPRRSTLGETGRLVAARAHAEPYVMYRRHSHPAVRREWLVQLARRPDVVYLDHLDSFQYADAPLGAGIPMVIDLHNIYSTIARRTAEEEANPLKRWYLAGEGARLARMEAAAARGADLVFAVSRPDAEHFRSLGARNVAVVPNGVDYASLSALPQGRSFESPVLLYLGSLSWRPNAQAAIFLARHVLPLVRAVYNDAELHVVGRDPGPDVLALQDCAGVTVAANVPSTVPYLERASVLAVPLDSGGGTRLKILEAFAAGLPVVSTGVGAEGIDAAPGHHYVLAERARFADAVLGLLAHPDEATRMAGAARELAHDVYDWNVIGERATGEIERLLQR
jgi:polysaccharide biosynthesis protein PslH